MNTALPCRRPLAVLILSVAATLGPVLSAGITPLRILQTIEPRFPSALYFEPISSGEARIVINVDDRGQLVDLLVAGYTAKPFADEAVAALRQWRYEPAQENGVPIGIRMELRFEFTAQGRVISLTPTETVNAFIGSVQGPVMNTRVCSPRELDQPVAAVETKAPYNPGTVQPEERRTVVIDFYVDESGRPRMPVVTKYAEVALAQAAVDALSQWRFTAPRRGGKPVAVKLQQSFVFLASS